MKKQYIIGALALLVAGTAVTLALTLPGGKTGGSADGEITFGDVYFPEKNTNAAAAVSASMAGLGTTLEEYCDESEFIIIAQVEASDWIIDKSIERPGLSLLLKSTRSQLKVIEVFKGELKPGERIYVQEMGSFEENVGDVGTIDGVPLMKRNMKVLLFLSEYIDDEYGRAYALSGSYQGKFFIDNKGNIHQSAYFGTDSFTLLDLPPTPYGQLKQQLKSICKGE